jgi:hypothetical protein
MSMTPITEMLKGVGPSAIGRHGPFTGKIALIGGNYAAGRDEHRTPLGTWQGVQIIAQTIESDIHGGGIRTLQERTAIAIDILAGYVLVALNYWVFLHSRRAVALRNIVLADAAAGILVPLAASAISFLTVAFWFNFIPMVVSVFCHEMYDHAREYQRLAAEHGIDL